MTQLPDIVANVARGWNTQPTGLALGSSRTDVSAAVWEGGCDATVEVSAAVDHARHIVSIPLTRFWSTMFNDGRRCWAKQVDPFTCTFVVSGRAPRALHFGRYRVLHIYLPTALVADATAQLEAPSGAPELIDPACTRDPMLERIARDVLAEMQEGAPLQQLRVDALGLDLAVQLLRRHSSITVPGSAGTPGHRGGLAPWQVRRVMDYLRDHLASNVTLAELAALVSLSSHHFCRAFRASTGLPPHRMHTRMRLERAQELLLRTDLAVGEVAAAVGYDDPSHLARSFRKETGLSPQQYRRGR